MADIVLTGDTSGSITVAAPAVAGTNTITLPASTGTMITSATAAADVPKPTALSTASGSAPSYSARAWVNFDGTAAAADMIRDSGNVSSITDNGTGNYDVNFTTAMPDVNYCVVVTGAANVPMATSRDVYTQGAAETTSIANVNAYRAAQYDLAYMSVAIFR